MTRWLLALLSLLLLAAPATAQKRIALTFDDVPRERGAFLTPDQRTDQLIAALKRARVSQAAFFVNPGFLAQPDGTGGERRIAAYAAAGHVLADHSFDHPHLGDSSAQAYLANIDRAETWLKTRPNRRPWFRFPFLDEGMGDRAKRDAVRAGLAARGLRNGYVTADGADWHMEQLTQRAARDGKAMNRAALGTLYVETMLQAANFAEALARRELGRSPAHVMLLHETDLAALYIADFVAALRRDGWTIVTADEAFADPLAGAMPDPPSANGTLIGQIALARDPAQQVWPDLTDAQTATRVFNQRVLRSSK